MESPLADWVAATGVWPVHDGLSEIVVPDHILNDPNLSLIAKGLFTLLLAEQGQPINPYDDAYEDTDDIAAAIEELIAAGLAARVTK